MPDLEHRRIGERRPQPLEHGRPRRLPGAARAELVLVGERQVARIARLDGECQADQLGARDVRRGGLAGQGEHAAGAGAREPRVECGEVVERLVARRDRCWLCAGFGRACLGERLDPLREGTKAMGPCEVEQPRVVDRADLQLGQRDRQRRLLAQRHERA